MAISDPFLVFFIALISAKIGGRIAKRFGQSIFLGEIMAGVVMGPAVIGLIGPDSIIELFGELGIFLLMFLIGLEINIKDLIKTSRVASATALGGIILPLALGWFTGVIFGFSVIQSLFLGVCLSITAVAVSGELLLQLKKLKTYIGQTIIEAAVFDDIFGLMILSALIGAFQTKSISFLYGFLSLTLKIVGFFLVATFFGYKILPFLLKYHGFLEDRETVFTFALLFALILGISARFTGLHGIIGAFIAGLFVRHAIGTGREEQLLMKEFSAISLGLFTPFFFIWLGLMVSFNALFTLPFLVIFIIIVACLGKILGAGTGALLINKDFKTSLSIGVGMNSRGAMALVVAEIGRRIEIINNNIFSVIIIMVLVATFITPILLKASLKMKT